MTNCKGMSEEDINKKLESIKISKTDYIQRMLTRGNILSPETLENLYRVASEKYLAHVRGYECIYDFLQNPTKTNEGLLSKVLNGAGRFVAGRQNYRWNVYGPNQDFTQQIAGLVEKVKNLEISPEDKYRLELVDWDFNGYKFTMSDYSLIRWNVMEERKMARMGW